MAPNALFWDVDTQQDFMDEDGRLAVPGAQEIVPNLEKLTNFAAERGIPIVASGDAHAPDDPEFEEFGRHCVAGTLGAEKISATRQEKCPALDRSVLPEFVNGLMGGTLGQILIQKQELDVFTVPMAEEVLARLKPEHVYVYGVATEYCVRATVLGLRERGYEATVIRDAIRGIDPDDTAEALEEMKEAGADLADTDEVLSALG